jgi:hypothetical protein
VAFGADGRVADDIEVSQVIPVTAAAGIFHHMTAIATELAHFTALPEKTRAHDGAHGESTPLFMAETALVLITPRQIPGTPPPRMEPHSVLACAVFGESLPMAAGTNCSDHPSIALQYFFVIIAVTGTATNVRWSVSALLPLNHRAGGFLLMTVNALIGEQDSGNQQQGQ